MNDYARCLPPEGGKRSGFLLAVGRNARRRVGSEHPAGESGGRVGWTVVGRRAEGGGAIAAQSAVAYVGKLEPQLNRLPA